MTAPEPRPAAVIVLVVGGRERALGHVDGRIRCDVDLIDDLLRLQLAARRRGGQIRLMQVRGDLHQLLELVGVAELLADPGAG
jgi:hypothetical protein